MLKILYVSGYPLKGENSPSINERQFISALSKRKDIDVYYYIPNESRDIINNDRTFYYNFYEGRIRDVFKNYIDAKNWTNDIVNLFNNLGCDFIVIRVGVSVYKCYNLSCKLPKKIILKSVGKFWMDTSSDNLLSNSLVKIYNFIFCRMLRNALGVETVTKKYREKVIESGVASSRVFVIPNSVDSDLFYPDDEDTSSFIPQNAFPVIGYVGSDPHIRGGIQIIKMIHKLQFKYPKIFGVIVGKGDHREKLYSLASKLKVANRLYISSWIDFEKIPSIMRSLTIGIAFAEKWRIRLENCSMKIRQYISSGVPVIANKNSNDFLEEHNLGSLVKDDSNIKEIICRVEYWIKKSQESKKKFKKRMHQYAKKNLSSDVILNKRLEHWIKLYRM